MKICKNCVMDSSDSKIIFDKNGVCDHCNTFKNKILPNWNHGKGHDDQLEKIISKMKKESKNKDFDCILGLSGGIDSSYLLHLVVKRFDLRPLVFHVDAGWNSQLATNNIENMIEKLNLDLYTEVINWNEMKDLQLSFFKSGVPHIDTPQDHAFFATMYKFANKHNVKSILTGANFSTECVRNPKEWMYFQSDSIQIMDIQKKFGNIKLIEFPLTNIIWHKIWLPYFRGIKVYKLLDLMEYNKNEALETLKTNYNFQPYPQKHFESRFTKFYESYWLFEKFGFDTRKVQFSSLILTKQMTREDAISKLRLPSYDENTIHDDIEFICNKLQISESELMSYLNSENKSYSDYRNQGILYDFGSKAMRRLGLERGGKR